MKKLTLYLLFMVSVNVAIAKLALAAEEPSRDDISVAMLNAMSKQSLGSPYPLIANTHHRESTSLNGRWNIIVDEHQFGAGGFLSTPYFQPTKPLANGLELREHSFDSRRQLNVPGDWNTQDEKLFRYRGVVWYQRNFTLDKKPNQRYFIHFDGVNYSANVYLNGQSLATHNGGYTPFNVEVSDHIKSGDNFLVVRVDAFLDNSSVPTLQTSDFFKYGGITRDVNLVEVDQTFARNYHVYLDNFTNGLVKAWVQLDGPGKANSEVTISIPEIGLNQTATSDHTGKARFSFNAELDYWSPESPKLYQVLIRHNSEKVEDQIGFRTFSVKSKQLVLNGSTVKLKGISMHDESPLKLGVASDLEDARTQLALIKEMNGNFVRLAHYPHNEHIVRLADQMGLLVWSEIPIVSLLDWENEQTLTTALGQMQDNVLRDLNRASVVIWSIANETMPQSEARLKFLGKLAATARRLDESQRPLAAALIGDAKTEFFHVSKRLILEMLVDPLIQDTATQLALQAAAKQMGLDKESQSKSNEIEIMLKDPLGEIIDIIGYNEYFGWYYSRPLSENLPVDEATVRRNMFKLMKDIRFRNKFGKPIIISEFGAGAKKSYRSKLGKQAIWTEGYQAKVYSAQLNMLSQNDWVQGWSPWILKDFRSALRQLNGIQDGYNRKGVISEKGEKKQAYYVLKKAYSN